MTEQEKVEFDKSVRRCERMLANMEKNQKEMEQMLNYQKRAQNIGEQVVDAAIGRGLDFMQFGVNLFIVLFFLVAPFVAIYVLFFE